MKKFQKTLTTQVVKSQFTSNEKPKTDFITLLPKILKILPQLGITNLFSSGTENPQTENQPSKVPQPTSLMKEENNKVVINTIEKHQQKVKEINKK